MQNRDPENQNLWQDLMQKFYRTFGRKVRQEVNQNLYCVLVYGIWDQYHVSKLYYGKI